MTYYRIVVFLILAALVYFIYQFMYLKPAFLVGEKIPDFKATTIYGKNFQSDDLKGKLTLLEFWGTWCGPCRKEMPQLSGIYRTYKDSLHGIFEIVTIAMDDDTAMLNKVIQQDSLVWETHLREPKDGGRISTLFEIKSIPTSYLLNEKLQIISVNPTIEELQLMINKVDEAHYSKVRQNKAAGG